MTHSRRLLFLLLVVLCSLGVDARTKKKQPPAETEQAVTKSSNPATPALQKPSKKTPGAADEETGSVMRTRSPMDLGPATEQTMIKAPGGPHLDLRALPFIPPLKFERPEHEEPALNPGQLGGTPEVSPDSVVRAQEFPKVATAIAPAPIMNFSGLDFANWGAGHPPDTNGDVGPTYYIQTINTSIGIFRKSDGVRVAAFTFNTFMSQGHFGNLCDTNNFGDPVVLYDTFEDRWIITDFAFQLDGSNNVINPPGNFQCFAVSMTGDPVSGGWNYYSINTTGGLGDYPKFGVWPDGIYMSTNMFNYSSGGAFQNSRLYAFNKAQMYAGNPSIQVVSLNLPSSQFTVLPANARLQTGTPPAGSPNYYASVWNFLNAIEIWKFHVDWTKPALSTVTGPFDSTMAFWWEQYSTTTAPSPANALDTLYPRLLVQNQYSNIGGVESLWDSHSVGAGNPTSSLTSTQAAIRYYQVNVTGGTVAANTVQSFTYSPDATIFRYMPSTAVDRAGDMAIGYTTSNATTNPTISYAGRLAGDPVNTITATEQTLIAGTGSQSGTCGITCTRWGDYSAMTLDPDGCTFWYTNEYYATTGLNHQTRVGSFAFPSCTPVGAGGTLSGSVTATVGGAPIVGATVLVGSRSATTNGSGAYTFSGIPAGTYATVTASFPGYVTGTATNVVITDGNTTIKNFSLTTAPTSGCATDTTQADFQAETATNIDLTTSAGDALLSKPDLLDQNNSTVSPTGFTISNTSWAGQTFTPALSGQLVRADIELFCSGCSGADPNITVSIRATTGATPVPTGADLASATLAGFNDGGAGGLKTVTFSTPFTVTAGTRYAVIFRAVAARTGSYAYTCSCVTSGFSNSSPYANGQRVTSTNSGSTWTADTTTGGRDLNFAIYINQGYATSGNLVSSNHDANTATGITPVWGNLSWTGVTPANTSLKFQVAASNSFSGPFNFVGPDGTAGTFFTTSPASLGQFYSFRYLQYKALLGTTVTTVTPTLNDATVCFTDLDCSAPATITPSAPLVCVSSTGNTASGPAGATSYAWSITNGTITGGASSQTVTFTAGASGSVGLNLTIGTADGCHHLGSASIPIGVATPTITPGGPTTFCAGGSVTLTSSSASGNQWSLNGNPIGGATNNTYNATASGNYTVTVTASGCTSAASAATTVTVNPIPATPTASNTGPYCAGATISLSTPTVSGATYAWTGPGGFTSALQNPTRASATTADAGTYSVTVTVSGCTSAAGTTSVVVNPIPATPAASNTGPYCVGGTISLSTPTVSGATYAWTGPGGFTSALQNPTRSSAATADAGTYSVTITVSGCTSAAGTTSVVVNPIPATPTASNTGPYCAGATISLSTPTVAGATYAWTGPGGFTSALQNPTRSNAATADAGTYSVTVTVGGCTSAAGTTSVVVNAIPATPTASNTGPYCAGATISLSTPTVAGATYAWTGPGGFTSALQNPTRTNAATADAGTYSVTITVSGCTSAAGTTSVVVNPIPATPTITPGGPTTFCAGGSVPLTSSSATGNQWFLNGNPIGGATNNTFSASASGDYTVTVTTSGCTSAASAPTTVTVNPIPATPTITPGGPTTFCAGGSVTLTSSSASGNQWYLNGNPIGGATNNTFVANASGSYTVQVTSLGCASSMSLGTTVTVNAIPATPTITPGGPTTFCAGGSVTLTSSSATGNQWFLNGNPIGGATNNTFSATASGNYTVTVTTSGCTSAASAPATVTVNPIPATPTITPGGPTTFCTGGSVTLTSSSASGNQWYLNGNPIGGATNNTFVANASGSYTVTVTSLGCTSAASAATSVTVNPIPATPTITPGGPTTFCSGDSVTLTSSSATGNQWFLNGNPIGGATNNTFVATAAGDYTVTVTAAGCTSAPSAATTVTVNPAPPTPTITPGGPTTFCAGGSVTLTSSSASGNQWYLNSNPIGGATSNTYLATAAGDYTVVVTAAGCPSLPSVATTVTVNPIPATPTITPGGPTTFCTGGSVTLTSSSASGNQWFLNGNPIGGATSNTYNATASGNYTVQVTSLGCASAMSLPTTVTVNPIPATPTITPGGPTTFCAGGSVRLTSSSATGNQWYLDGNPIGGATTNLYTATAPGSYTVTVTAAGCTSAPSIPITVTVNPIPPTPVITPGGPTTFCTGGSVTLTSSSATGNQWYLNGNPIGGATNNTFIATASGNYTAQVTSLGCVSAMSLPVTVTVNPIPATPTITPGGPTTFCAGGSVTLTSSSATGNQWSLNGNPIGGATNNTFVASASGNYTVTVTSGGCTSAASAPTSVTVTPLPATPTISAGGPTSFCTGGSVTLTSSSATGNQWFLNGNPIGGATNNTYIANAAGDYTVTVTSGGCTSAASAPATVTVSPVPATPTITPGGPTTFCSGDSVTLTSSSASGNQWSLNGNPIGGATGNTYIATAAGDYTVTVTSGGCPSAPSAATTVTVNPAPPAPAITPGGPTTFCTGGSVTLTSSSATGNQWSLNGNPIGGATGNTFIATASGNYTVTVTSGGCTSLPSLATTVTVNPIPATPTITPGGPTTFCTGGSVTLTSSSASGNQWYLNGNPIGGATSNTFVANASGSYTVTVTASGCTSAASAPTSVTVNPIPSTPTITPGGPTTFCAGGSVTLTSSSASGNQWLLNGNPIGGATNNTFIANASGNYTVTVTASGCTSAASAATTVTVNPIPATPTITPGGPTTFCAGGSVTLTSSSASGNQWFLNGNPIGGATNNTFSANASGNYTVTVTASGCTSASSAPTSVTVNPIPATPTITPGGPTTFCAGGSVMLTSSSASGNQWLLNGNPIGGATSQTYNANAAGDYSVRVTTSGCTSAASAATTVTINPNPNATITVGGSMASGASAPASVASAGAGATYVWSITNGSITGGAGTSSITFTAGAVGTLTLNVTVTTAAGCSDAKSANVTVTTPPPSVTITSIVPNHGRWLGGTSVTINGTGFQSGATVTIGGNPATSVVVVNATRITAATPAHAAGTVNVTVTNPDTTTFTAAGAFTYTPQQFDPNGDSVIDPADVFYLVNYLFTNGPAPTGAAGMLSGDANGDGVVDPADIFYVVNYLFTNGPQPMSGPLPARSTNATSSEPRISGAISLGAPVARGGRWVVPVILTLDRDSAVPQALALKVRGVRNATIRRAGAANGDTPVFEISRHSGDELSYLVAGVELRSSVIAEIEFASAGGDIEIDAAGTMLSNLGGTRSATVAGGTLTVSGTTIDQRPREKRDRND